MGAPEDKNHLSSKEAADLLRIKPQTLYAYVSRGWIRSIGKDKRRGFLYSRDDVERLRARGHARAEGGVFKRGTPRWSEPIVQSSITKITPGGPEYRGHPALNLARVGHRFENVAEMLWTGTWVEEAIDWRIVSPPIPMDRVIGAMGADLTSPDVLKPLSALVMTMAVRPDGTNVTIKPSVDIVAGTGVAGSPKATPITYPLKKGQVIRFEQATDLLGSIISSNNPIGV